MRCCLILTTVLIAAGGTNATAQEAEWETNTAYYEDDAWYDISEWFDGNDYNPTDEEFGEWDDEVYNRDLDETDQDNDAWYGYNATIGDDDNWFYDYYDYGYDSYTDYDGDDLYESGFRYYDYDNDGSYDAYATWYDWDKDGFYEDYNYYSFASQRSVDVERRAQEDAPRRSRRVQSTGTIENVKTVNVRGQEHTVIALKAGDKTMAADLGRSDKLDTDKLQQGEKITVNGINTKVGDKTVLIAQKVDLGSELIKIDRSRPQFQGEVVDRRTVKVWGRDHVLAMVKNDQGNKVAVDFGPKSTLKVDFKKGDQLTFSGAPARVQDKLVVMALTIQRDGESVPIDRRQTSQQS